MKKLFIIFGILILLTNKAQANDTGDDLAHFCKKEVLGLMKTLLESKYEFLMTENAKNFREIWNEYVLDKEAIEKVSQEVQSSIEVGHKINHPYISYDIVDLKIKEFKVVDNHINVDLRERTRLYFGNRIQGTPEYTEFIDDHQVIVALRQGKCLILNYKVPEPFRPQKQPEIDW